jgi:SH3 domain protein
MKKICYLLSILLFSVGSAQADIIYVADDLNLSLRDAPTGYSHVLKVLPTGSPLTVIGKNTRTGFIRVRLTDGTEGYFKTRYTKTEPPVYDIKDASGQSMSLLQNENAAIKAELETLKASVTPGTSLEQSLAKERDQLSRELTDIKRTAANAVQLKAEHDALQERIVKAEREVEQYKLDNQVLKDTSKQDWFLYGGALALIGVLLGFILPKLSWKRKSGWDSY